MSKDFYIEEGDNLYALTVTTDVDLNYSGTPTKNAVEAGFNATDHYMKDNVKITFNGMLSNIKNLTLPSDMSRNVEDNITAITGLWESAGLFTVYVEGRVFENCLFTTLSFSKKSGIGTSYAANWGIEQVRVSERAELVSIPEQSPETQQQHESLSSSGDSNTKEEEDSSLLGYLSDADNPSAIFLLGQVAGFIEDNPDKADDLTGGGE